MKKEIFTPLSVAEEEGNKELVDLLIEFGTDINEKGAGGYTPLSIAIWKGNNTLENKLIKLGADID